MKKRNFDLPERDVMLAETLECLRELRFRESERTRKNRTKRGFDIYDLVARQKPVELSKSRANHFGYTKQVRQTINDYLTKFLPSMETKEGEVANNGSHLQKTNSKYIQIPPLSSVLVLSGY